VAGPLALLGVPTSAGTHGPGQEKAPGALRAAGLAGALEAAGVEVQDEGDLPAAMYRAAVADPRSATWTVWPRSPVGSPTGSPSCSTGG